MRLAHLAVLATLLTACASGPDPDMPSLAGTSWQLVSINGKPALADVDFTMAFDEQRLSGNTGINRFSGPWSWSGGTFDAGPFAMTRAAGAPAVMEQEHVVIAALDGADRVRIDGDKLVVGTGDSYGLVFTRLR